MPRPLSKAFSSLRYNLIKGPNNKYNAFCTVCKKTLCNTAAARLRAHRNRCRMEGESGNSVHHSSSVFSKTCDESSFSYSKNCDPLHNYSIAEEEPEIETTNIYPSEVPYDDVGVDMRIVDLESVTKDECVAFGQYVTTQLRKMDSKTCALVRFKICETLFNAEIGKLYKDEES